MRLSARVGRMYIPVHEGVYSEKIRIHPYACRGRVAAALDRPLPVRKDKLVVKI